MNIKTMAGGFQAAVSPAQSQERAKELARFTQTLPGNGGSSSMRSSINRKLKFVVNHESNKVTVNVIDGNTNKIIKVLPPEELQRLSNGSTIEAGTLFDERV